MKKGQEREAELSVAWWIVRGVDVHGPELKSQRLPLRSSYKAQSKPSLLLVGSNNAYPTVSAVSVFLTQLIF